MTVTSISYRIRRWAANRPEMPAPIIIHDSESVIIALVISFVETNLNPNEKEIFGQTIYSIKERWLGMQILRKKRKH